MGLSLPVFTHRLPQGTLKRPSYPNHGSRKEFRPLATASFRDGGNKAFQAGISFPKRGLKREGTSTPRAERQAHFPVEKNTKIEFSVNPTTQ